VINRLSFLVAFASLAATAAPAAPVADHRALYEIRLARSNPGSGVQGVSGEMVLEVKSQCTATIVNQAFRSDFWGADSKPKHSELSISSLESRDGSSFRFSLHNVVDGLVTEDFKGIARRGQSSGAGAITYEAGAFPRAPLPQGALFPTAHMEQLLAAAKAGEHSHAIDVFDGAEKGKVYRATSVIGRKGTSRGPVPKELDGLDHWPVTVSYYPIGSTEPLPEYESSFDLYSNGVSAAVLLDYGDFAMRADLTQLRLMPTVKCDGP
jgi:hypothetical protein